MQSIRSKPVAIYLIAGYAMLARASDAFFIYFSGLSQAQEAPGATLRYARDQKRAIGTELTNSLTKRMRHLVLDSVNELLHRGDSQRRDLNADFLHSFGSERSTVPPPPLDMVVGADSDNTGGSNLGDVGDVGDVSLVEQ